MLLTVAYTGGLEMGVQAIATLALFELGVPKADFTHIVGVPLVPDDTMTPTHVGYWDRMPCRVTVCCLVKSMDARSLPG